MDGPSGQAELIDRIYECSFVPELWPEVLRDTSKKSNFGGAALYVTNPDVTAWTATRNSRPIIAQFVAEGRYWRGPMMPRVHHSRHPGFLRDVDLCSEEEMNG